MTDVARPATPGSSQVIPRDGDTIDWARVTQEIHCSRCGYNLRGIEWPRCPECGWAFEWEEIFFAERRPHPYLYEHHIGQDKFRRFRKTLLGALRPIKFWRTMRITHLHRRGPLIGFALRAWLIVTLNALLLSGLYAAVQHRQLSSAAFRGPGASMPSGTQLVMGFVEGIMDVVIEAIVALVESTGDIEESPFFIVVLAWLACAMVPVTVLGYWLFGITLRKHKVLTPHLWRLAIYPAAANLVVLSSLLLVVAAVVVMGLGVAAIGTMPISWTAAEVIEGGLGLAGALLGGALVLHWTISLLAGGYVYLKVPRWWVVVLASQIVAGLVALNVILPMTI